MVFVRMRGSRKRTIRPLVAGLLALAFALGAGGACGRGGAEEGDEVYLRGTTGAYRGRVIDAATKQPIAGAVVLAVWYYHVPTVAGRLTHFHDALEVLTDAQGNFVVDAPRIERWGPRRLEFPVFTIFKPGYRFFQGWFAHPEVMAERAKRPLLGVVELTPNVGRGRQARLENLPPGPGPEIPREKIPNFLRAIAEEEEAIKREF